MRSRELLIACLSLIICSILILPGSTYVGVPENIAMMLSSMALLAGIASAIKTIDADLKHEKERKNVHPDKK
ncbi:hypothetical protein CUJ83_01435 [Methanocella sp. CWC-04]|uniref:Uncharacterized protein n=1 Tax=Methanooceanicella nereidis TaxID=2052831 RepID=A0AAP2RA01_9EURY|nr:hypothetical protein [Methanocella sp. CWC-04]MCD1293656.1 hypothetical protein [Methanocella sp. CWC-04]